MHRRNPTLGLVELWNRLKLRGYTRWPESLFQVMRELGMFPQEKKKKVYIPKPYQQMTYPGQRIQVDVKVVPRRYITAPELRSFQYTAIDEFFRRAVYLLLCVLPETVGEMVCTQGNSCRVCPD